MIHILLIDKNAQRAKDMASALSEMNYASLYAKDTASALSLYEQNAPQFVIASAECGGIALCRELRDSGDRVPVFIITQTAEQQERRRIFSAGADGCLTDPLDLEELQMRVKNLLWRCRVDDDSTLTFGNCVLHSHTLTLETPDGDIELRRMEFLLLEKLLSYPGRIFTRTQLMDDVWGYDSQSTPRTVDTHVRRLRQKLRSVEDIRLQTVRGVGYRIALPRRMRKPDKKDKNSK